VARLWPCSPCRYHVSITVGTVLHKTYTPLHLWSWAAYLMSAPTRGRRAMANPERAHLLEEVEVDERFVGGVEAGLRGGRTRGEKALVPVGVEVRCAGSGRVRMAVINDASGSTLTGSVHDNVAVGATVHTDAGKGYRGLGRLGYDHRPHTQRAASPAGDDLDEILPRVHSAISNLKSWLQGTSPRRLQRTLAGLPRRVHLPPQPPRYPEGRLPDASRPAEPAAADCLPQNRRYRPKRQRTAELTG
jgi:hypothetical protein